MKANIPGEREGMYMATDSMFVDVEDIVVKGEDRKSVCRERVSSPV